MGNIVFRLPYPLLQMLQMVIQRHRCAYDTGVFALHNVNRDGGKVGIKPPFAFKTLAKRRRLKIIDKARDDAAAKVHAAARAQREREVGGDCAEHGAEHIQREAAKGRCAAKGFFADFGGGEFLPFYAFALGECFVNQHQACAA